MTIRARILLMAAVTLWPAAPLLRAEEPPAAAGAGERRLIREEEVDPEAGRAPSAHALPAAPLCARAERLLEDGGRPALVRAREMFTAVTRVYPQEACGHAGLARALTFILSRAIEQDDSLIGLALEEARTAVRLDPAAPEAHTALALALLADLQPHEAEEAADRAVELGPGTAAALVAAAATRLSNGRLPKAREAAERAVAGRPDLFATHHALGNVALFEGKIDDAIDSYLRALVLSPEALPSRFQLAVALEQAGQIGESSKIFKQVMERHPEDAGLAQLYMAHSLVVRGNHEPALTVLDRVSLANVRGVGRGTVRFLQGLCLEKLLRREEAMAAYRDVIENYPEATAGHASPHRLVDLSFEGLARLAFAAGRPDEAREVMDRGTADPRAGADLLLRLAHLFEDYAMPERSLPLLERACSGPLRPRTAGTQLAACVSWARLARARGDAPAMGRLGERLQAARAEIEALEDLLHDLTAMRALSIAGHGPRSLDILRAAVSRGYAHLAWIRDDPDLEALRSAPGFETVMAGAPPAAATAAP